VSKPFFLLAIPPAPYLISDRVFPHLGIMYLASWLRKHGCGVAVADLTGGGDWRAVMSGLCSDVRPDIIGVTASSPDFPQALSLLAHCREACPSAQVWIGGPHATMQPEDCSAFDKVICGDGWSGTLAALKPGSPRVIREAIVTDFSSVPFPARHLVDLDSYVYTLEGRRATSIMSHLGCPYQCAFCSGRTFPFFTRVRWRTPESVVAEMELVRDTYGYSAFVFFDDEFNLDKRRLLALCAAIKGRDFVWRAPVRTDLTDTESAAAMRASGCVEVTVGIESGSAAVLERIGKGTTPELNSRARRIYAEAGIRFKAFIIAGLPGASVRDEEMTKRWLIENRPDGFDISINTPFPGAKEYCEPESYGLSYDCDYSNNVIAYKTAPHKFRVYARNEHMGFSEILKLRDAMDAEVRAALGLPSPEKLAAYSPVDHSKGGVAPGSAGLLRSAAKRRR